MSNIKVVLWVTVTSEMKILIRHLAVIMQERDQLLTSACVRRIDVRMCFYMY